VLAEIMLIIFLLLGDFLLNCSAFVVSPYKTRAIGRPRQLVGSKSTNN